MAKNIKFWAAILLASLVTRFLGLIAGLFVVVILAWWSQ